jgi:NADPH-dependent curcumin reductase CurA
MRAQQIHLARRPVGLPTAEDFTMVDTDLPDPAEGEVLVENLWLSVDPYMRGRMLDRASYVEPFAVGAPMEGGAIGRVLASEAPDLAEGDVVRHMLGWRSHAVAGRRAFSRVDPDAAPLPAYLGILGMPGMTAYVGLLDIARAEEGETVVVSGAAGAVGSAVGQIARRMGCRVVGSAGSQEKVDWLTGELGFDAAFSYRERPYAEALDELCPDGIDVVFENVGGEHLAAVVPRMAEHGRIAICGLISEYNATEPTPGPNLWAMIRKRITMQGFLVRDHDDRAKDFLRDMSGWLAAGEITERETVVEGLERMPEAFLGLFTGDNIGKMVVRV